MLPLYNGRAFNVTVPFAYYLYLYKYVDIVGVCISIYFNNKYSFIV